MTLLSCKVRYTYCRFPFIEHIFYDNTYKDRSPTHKFIKTIDVLAEIGQPITDQQLEEAKFKVQPDFILHHAFTSVCLYI